MEHSWNQVGLQPRSPTLSAAYVWNQFSLRTSYKIIRIDRSLGGGGVLIHWI